MRKKYICFDGTILPYNFDVNKKSFDGYEVVYQPSGSIWRITEVLKSENTGLEMKFWPSRNNNSINYVKHYKRGLCMWYNTAGILDSVYHEFNYQKHGECISKNTKYYYYYNDDITEDVKSFTENYENFSTEDRFNLFLRYGSDFKLYDEYIYHIDLESIIKLCS